MMINDGPEQDIDSDGTHTHSGLGVPGPKGEPGEPGEVGDPGKTGKTGESSPDVVNLIASMTVLTGALTEHSIAMIDLSTNFKESAAATLKRVTAAFRLNIISSIIGIVVLIGLGIIGYGENQIHSTQKTNGSILNIVKNDSTIIANVTNPNSKFSQQSSEAFVTLLNDQAACLANHGDRNREILAHVKVTPLRAGCNLDGTLVNGTP